MKKNARNTPGLSAWFLGGLTSLLMCASALGQGFSATQSNPTAINDSPSPGVTAIASPYPSSINLSNANLVGTIERVDVSLNSFTLPYTPDIGLLLVGPNNSAVVLMSGSGDSTPLNAATLTFSGTASSSLPVGSPILSGSSYQPTANANPAVTFPGPAPAAPTGGYPSGFGQAFGNINPNGLWSLYAVDTLPGPTGTSSLGSWTLTLFTTPTIAILTNSATATNGAGQVTTTVNENGSVTVNLILASSSTAVGNLTVTAAKIPTLVTNFSYAGTDQNRTVTITPNANTFGSGTLTITVNDGVGSTSTNINLVVPHVIQAPQIALSTNAVTTVAGLMTTNVVVATLSSVDVNFDPNILSKLNLSATSSDSTIVSPSGVFFSSLTAAGDKRSVTVVPAGAGTGTATLTIMVDNGTLTNSQTLTVTVLPVQQPLYANSNAVSVAASGTATATISIPANAISGLIGKVTVAVAGLKNIVPGSTGITLKAPSGQTVTLLNSGAATAQNYGQVLFQDGGAAGGLTAPDNLTNTIKLAPAIGSSLAALIGSNPNGNWILTVNNGGTAAAQILDGFALNIYAAPTISSIANVFINEEQSATRNFTVASINGTVTNVSATIPSNPGLATFTTNLNGNNATLTIQGNFNQPGTNLVQVIAQDNNGFTATNTFTLGLAFVDHPPTLDFIGLQVGTIGKVVGPIAFKVHDVDVPPYPGTISQVTVRANSDNQKLLPDGNIQLQVTGVDLGATPPTLTGTLTLFPIGTAGGTVNLTLTANDGITSSAETFAVFLQAPGNPLFAVPSTITINANSISAPYPSTNTVSGLIGTVETVSVTLFDLTDQTPDNLKLLLVGPTGANVLLMQGAGGANALVNTSIILDDTASAPLPQNALISSGTYKPTIYGAVTSLPASGIAGQPPAAPYGTLLNPAFTNTTANGDWKLYVADSGSSKGGAIFNGWQLSIVTAPTIPAIKDQVTDENVTGKVTITVGDNQPGVDLTVIATNNNPGLFQPITVSGTGSTRTLAIAPQPYMSGTNVTFGTNVITVIATDPAGHSSIQTFNMSVRPVAQPPLFINPPGDQTILAATQLPPISFSVWPPQGGALTVTASSPDNATLVPSVEIDAAGSTSGTNNYTLTLFPAGVLTGTATITIAASDTSGQKATSSFKLTVNPNLAFANTPAISIPAGPFVPGQLSQGTATPYPSVVSVKGVGGLVNSVQATLIGFNHPHPSDVDLLLVAPDNSTAVMLMAHAGDATPVTGLRLTFSDAAAAPAPPSAGLASQSYKPSDYTSGLTLPSPAPTRPYQTTLTSAFQGMNPNGDWKLYVLDDTYPDAGSIDSGWIIFFQTSPAIAQIPDQITLENVPISVPLTLTDSNVDPTNLAVTVTTSGDYPAGLVPPGLVPASNISVAGTGANRTLFITNALNQPSAYNILNNFTNSAGTNLITVTVTDLIHHLSTSTSFGFKVQYVNQTPTVNTSTNRVFVQENGQIATTKDISFTVGDVDSPLYLSNIVVTSSDQTLVANSNIVASIGGLTSGGTTIAPGTTATVNVHVVPTKNAYGTDQLSFAVTDGTGSATNLLSLVINHVWQNPTISAIGSQHAFAGSSTTNIAFTVGSVEVSAKSLVVTAVSDNPGLVPNTPANILLGGAAEGRTIQLTTIGTTAGTANITVTVNDGAGTSNSVTTTSFVLNVDAAQVNTFANTSAITTTGAGKANLYPSPITVAGLSGATFKVDVVLPVFTHNAPANLDVLLVQRNSDTPSKVNAVMLMSGAGGTAAVSGLRLSFDDLGALLPTTQLTSGTYQPANYIKGGTMPAPAPTNTLWSATLSSAFAGLNPNGTWELYVNDRVSGDSGSIGAGWQLLIQTGPTITGVPASLTIPENGTANASFSIGDTSTDVSNLTVTATSDNAALLPARNVTFTQQAPQNGGHTQAWVAAITPTSLLNGTVNLTLTVSRSDGASASSKIAITVTPVNVAPSISRLDNIAMPDNITSNIQFTVFDPDTPLSALIIKATSDTPGIILNNGVGLSINGSGTNQLTGLPNNIGSPQTSLVTLGITPVAFSSGIAHITVTVSDPEAGVGTNTVAAPPFQVTVTAVVSPPFFSTKIGAQSVAAGGTLQIPFAVGSLVSAANTLVTTGTSDSPSLVTSVTTALASGDASGTNRVASITAVGQTQGGTANVTLKVTDPSNGAITTTTFALTVRPSRTRNYINSTAIQIVDNKPGIPYPSQISVSDLVGPISKVTATLQGFTHTYPDDVGVMLVGPTGQQIVLMDHTGTTTPASNLQLTFDQSAAIAIPQNTALTNGTYQPKDYSPSGQRVFASPAPSATNTTLNGFNGSNPNGTWALYVEDFSVGDFGWVSNGWSLAITTLPVINGLTDVTTNENLAASEAFTVADDTLSTPIFNFSATSDNQSVVTNAGITFSGSGTNWVVNVNPVPNAFGSANITVTMVNGDGQTITARFKATFNQVFYPPFILGIADQTIPAGSNLSLSITYGNIGLSQSSLTLTFQSSNTNLVPVGNIKVIGSQLFVSPVGVATGTSAITVTVSNPSGQTASSTFNLSVTPNANAFASSGAINIPDVSRGQPYPSTINIAGLAGNIVKVTATVVGLGHGFPSDISMLLVGPQGQKVVLMSRAGGSAAISNTRLTFDDTVTAVLPQFSLITDGTYKPTDYNPSDTYFPPAPTAPYSHQLNAFNGTNPNGTWSLYVQDDQSGDFGAITGGWVLNIQTTGPTLSGLPASLTLPENNTPDAIVNFSVGSSVTSASNLIVTASSSGVTPAGLVGKLTLGGAGASRTLQISLGSNLPSVVTNVNGTATITLTVTDGTLTNSQSFPLTVTYVNQAPVVAGLTDQTTAANVPLTLNFTVSDVDNATSNLVVAATSSTPALGSVAVGGTDANRSLTFTPAGVIGVDQVSVTVSDGPNTVTNNITITVTNGTLPVVTAIADQTIPKALSPATVVVSFMVDTGPLGATNLEVLAATDNTNLVTNIVVTGTAPSFTATASVAPLMTGTAFITVFARDQYGTGTSSFHLNVTPTNYPPTLGPIADVTNKVNTAVVIPLTVSDPDTALSSLTFNGTSSNPSLVSGVTFANNGTTVSATVNLVANASGTAVVTINVSDGTSTASQHFNLTITSAAVAPTLGIKVSGTQVTLTLKGAPNTTYTLQGSSDLKTWTNAGSVTTDATGAGQTTVTKSASHQFYRAQFP